LLKQIDNKESIAMNRRMAGWNADFLAKVLGIPTTWFALALGCPWGNEKA
jgi:hypothetical protein